MAISRQTSARQIVPEPYKPQVASPDVWQGFLISQDEMKRVDRLMGNAMLDSALGHRLVHQRDGALLASFGLSLETQKWLRSIEATTLDELAAAIVICA
jgi:hypothetical protein